uniref:Uncharacterized protein n=1 Tax=Cacopsylla melanoneura TaxID=428564 RepID=A0A8D9EZK9_9HEMI
MKRYTVVVSEDGNTTKKKCSHTFEFNFFEEVQSVEELIPFEETLMKSTMGKVRAFLHYRAVLDSQKGFFSRQHSKGSVKGIFLEDEDFFIIILLKLLNSDGDPVIKEVGNSWAIAFFLGSKLNKNECRFLFK